MFLVKAEKAIAAKVSADELERAARQHEAELEELSARLPQAHKPLVRWRGLRDERKHARLPHRAAQAGSGALLLRG